MAARASLVRLDDGYNQVLREEHRPPSCDPSSSSSTFTGSRGPASRPGAWPPLPRTRRRRATFFTPEPGEGEPDVPQNTGPTVDESTKRQVVNNYPVLPFVIPIPVGGAAGSSMARSKNTVREVIPSAHDLGAQAKWNGFWKTVQDVAALKLNRNGSLIRPDVASYDASGKGLAPAMTHANRKDGFAPGMVGADFVYAAPVDALGRSLDNPPVSVPGAGAVVDAGNPFF